MRCPNCNKGYLVEAESLGSEFPCPGCTAIIPAEQVGIESAVDRIFENSGVATPQAAAAAAATAPVAKPMPAPAASAAPVEEVVCPRCKLHFVPRRRTDGAPSVIERPTVLVVEDMSYFQEIARDALAARYEVRTAQTAAEARAVLAAGGVDLLVLDLTLDGGDHGLDLLREFPRKPCPILIYTAQDESEMYGDSWEELQKLGADDIVIKGMNVGESLVRKVGALLGLDVED